MTASAWGLGFAWGFDLFCLGMDFFKRVAWGSDFQGLVCLGTSILAPFLLGVLLGVDLLGAVKEGQQLFLRQNLKAPKGENTNMI